MKEDAIGSISTTLTSIHTKELMANGQVFDKDMEIRKFKNDINELKSKSDILVEEVRFSLFNSVFIKFNKHIYI